MKPAEYATGHYLEETLQLHVPSYQRPYSWEADRLVDLWRDVANQYRSAGKAARSHFMGAMIVERNDEASSTGITALNIIDGQQRLLTLLTLLAAIRDQIFFEQNRPVPKDNDTYLVSPKFSAPAPRVFPKVQDKAAMDAILQGRFVAQIDDDLFDHLLANAYRFFRYQLWLGKESVLKHTLNLPPRPVRRNATIRGSFEPWGKPSSGKKGLDLPKLHGVVTGELKLLELMIEKTDEEAGVVFETMNAKSTPLRQFDLLRNSIFVRMPRSKDAFYEDVWQHVEATLDEVSYPSLRDKPQEQFFYEYVITSGGAGVSKDSLHRRWLSGVIEDQGYVVTAASERAFRAKYVDPLVNAAILYPLAVGKKKVVTFPDGRSAAVSDDEHAPISEIMAMSGGPAVPLILKALMDRSNGLSDGDFESAMLDIQSFLVRQVLSGETFSPLRGTMMVVASKLPSPFTLTGLRAALRDAGWKSDSDVLSEVASLDTKTWASASFFPILRGIERQLSGISAHPLPFGSRQNQFSIEHIYPQTANIGPGWESDLLKWGVSRDDVDARRYALGNLTAVTGYDNKRNGKKRFGEKTKLISATANLKLHASFVGLLEWTPAEIDARTERLARAALARWPRH